MRNLETYLVSWSPCALSLLRIVTGFLFTIHGAQKLFGFPSAPEGGKPPLASLYGVAGMLEFFGGLLITIGLFTHYVAFRLSGEMTFAYFMVHAPRGLWPVKRMVSPPYSSALSSSISFL